MRRLYSESTVWRLLDQAEIKPHKWRYWLNSPDPDFKEKMLHIVDLYLNPPEGILLCLDEKTGVQALERKYPDLPTEPGKPCRREHSYIRHGTRDLLASFEVKTGKIFAQFHEGHSSPYWETFIKNLVSQCPKDQQIHMIEDNYSTHSTPGICQVVAELSHVKLPELKTQEQRRQWLMSDDKRIVLHFLPTHASWLNQVEIWFSIYVKKFWKRSSFTSRKQLVSKSENFFKYYNMELAHPFKWVYTGKPLSV